MGEEVGFDKGKGGEDWARVTIGLDEARWVWEELELGVGVRLGVGLDEGRGMVGCRDKGRSGKV